MSDFAIYARDNSLKTRRTHKTGAKAWMGTAIALSLLGGGLVLGPDFFSNKSQAAVSAVPSVVVSTPAERSIEKRLQFLGQFSAVKQVEVRPQVGGTLNKISFKDGDIVQKGDLLFEIDPTPYQIKLNQATAQLDTARARLDLATRQSDRAETLKQNGFGTVENADQRGSEKRAAQAAVDAAEAAIRDARFDLDHTRLTAPFTGRIGTHLVSEGNLISGSRAGAGPTSLLATLVSVDSIYLNFDMSEADYAAFRRERAKQEGALSDKVDVSVNGEGFNYEGTLDFVDNVLDRSSGTIHARATLKNTDGSLTPGGFARVRVALSKPTPALLVPDASVLPDQADHIVLTVGADDVVTPKKVELGDLRGGLRVVQSGLSPSDRVIVEGIPMAKLGSKVLTETKAIRFTSN